MCDYISWLHDPKTKKNYFLTDDMIEAKWPDANFQDKIGHKAIADYFGSEVHHLAHAQACHLESVPGHENRSRIPQEIAKAINSGQCRKMAISGDADPSQKVRPSGIWEPSYKELAAQKKRRNIRRRVLRAIKKYQSLFNSIKDCGYFVPTKEHPERKNWNLKMDTLIGKVLKLNENCKAPELGSWGFVYIHSMETPDDRPWGWSMACVRVATPEEVTAYKEANNV